MLAFIFARFASSIRSNPALRVAAALGTSIAVAPTLADCPSVTPEFLPREFLGDAKSALFHTDSVGRALFLGGDMTFFNGRTASGLQRLAGSVWTDVGLPRLKDARALATFGGQLIVAGEFSSGAFAIPLRDLAAWNGSTFVALPGAPRFRDISTLHVANGRLFVGAESTDEPEYADGVAQWDGATWTVLPISNAIRGVDVLTSLQGAPVVIGEDTASYSRHILRWTGSQWERIGDTDSIYGYYASAAEFENLLVVGGEHNRTIDGVAVGGAAAWDGTTWSNLGIPDDVFSILVHDGEIYFGQRQQITRGLGASAVVIPVPVDAIRALAIDGDTLIAVGGHELAAFDGTSWSMLGLGAGGGVQYIPAQTAVHALDEFNGQLIVAGKFAHVGGVPAANIARWDGTRWAALGDGLPGATYQLLQFNNELVARTTFPSPSWPFGRTGFMRWNGAVWQSLPLPNSSYPAFACAYDGELYVTGEMILSAGDDMIHSLARWDGVSWRPAGLNSFLGYGVGMTVFQGELLLFGRFDDINEIPGTAGVARWNGQRWAALAAPVPFTYCNIADVIGDTLYVTGTTEHEDAPPDYGFYQFDGTTWRLFSTAVPWAPVLKIGNRLLSYGRTLDRWTGEEWMTQAYPHTEGSVFDTDTYITAAREFQGDLYLGGNFTDIGVPTSHLAHLPTPAFPPDVHISGPPTVCPGGELILHATVTGDGPFTYRWTFGYSGLPEDEVFSGTRTATLRIAAVLPEDAGYYRVAVTNACMQVWGSFKVAIPSSTIRGDVNCDAVVNNFDIDAFVLALVDRDQFIIQYPCCELANGDINLDNRFDMFDIDPFVECIVSGVRTGCP